jgi:hypothetical protein
MSLEEIQPKASTRRELSFGITDWNRHMKRAIHIALAALILALSVAGIWSLVMYAGLQSSLLWTAIIGAAAWAIRSNVEQKREYQKLLAERKQEHYFQFLQFLSKFIDSTQKTMPIAATKTQGNVVPLEEFRMWSLRLTLIGSDDVVREWNNARNGREDPAQPYLAMKRWGRLWLAMRRDCGHVDTKLSITDVLESFVNDIEKHREYFDK